MDAQHGNKGWFILGVADGKKGVGQGTVMLKLAILLAFIVLLLFSVNWSMFLLLRAIRYSRTRKTKVRLARFTRYVMKAHIPFALLGSGLILVHAVLMVLFHPLPILQVKKLSGFAALLILGLHLYSGYLKYRRTSKKRQRIHVVTAFTLLLFIMLHTLL